LSLARSFLPTLDKVMPSSLNRQYHACIDDHFVGITLVDKVYSMVGEYSVPSKKNADIVDAHLKEKLSNTKCPYVGKSEGRIPRSVNVDFDTTTKREKVNFGVLWSFCISSQNSRGGDKKGIGALTASYYSFDMPSHYVKAISRAREIIGMCRLLSIYIVRLPSSQDFPSLLIEILIYNGVSVCTDSGVGVFKIPEEGKQIRISHYRSSVETCLQIIANPITSPVCARTGISLNLVDFDNRMGIMDPKHNGFNVAATFTYLTPQVVAYAEKHKYAFYPSMSPHACKIWMVGSTMDFIENLPTVPQHMVRMHDGIKSRNLYLLTRRSFFYNDVMRSFFADKILIKKIVRKINKDPEVMDVKLLSTADECHIPENVIKSIQAMAIEQNPARKLCLLVLRDYETKNNLEMHFDSLYSELPTYMDAYAHMEKEERFVPFLLEYDQYEHERVRRSQLQAFAKLQYDQGNRPGEIEMPLTQNVDQNDERKIEEDPPDVANLLQQKQALLDVPDDELTVD